MQPLPGRAKFKAQASRLMCSMAHRAHTECWPADVRLRRAWPASRLDVICRTLVGALSLSRLKEPQFCPPARSSLLVAAVRSFNCLSRPP